MEKSKVMMIIIIVLLVALLGTVVGVAFYIMNMVRNTQTTPNEYTATTDHITKHLKPEEITKVSLGDSILTNLAKGEDGKSYIARIKVLVGYDNTVKKESDAFAEVLTNNMEFMRSIALSCLRNSTYEDLTSDGGESALADRIKTMLQSEFDTTLIVNVYFDDWLIQ